MSDIAVFVGGIAQTNPPSSQYMVFISTILIDSQVGVSADVLVDFDAPVPAINQSIMDAAIAAVVAAGFTVGPHDSKRLFCGAQ